MGVRRLSIWVRVERICSMNGVDLGSRKASHLGTRRQVRFVVDSRLCRSFLPSRRSHSDSRILSVQDLFGAVVPSLLIHHPTNCVGCFTIPVG